MGFSLKRALTPSRPLCHFESDIAEGLLDGGDSVRVFGEQLPWITGKTEPMIEVPEVQYARTRDGHCLQSVIRGQHKVLR